MADEYTPTTSQQETDIRNVYALHFGDGDLDRGYQNFDRWLAAHDREVAAKALRDAADAWHAENAGTSPRVYGWLWERADEIGKGADHDPR